MQLLKSLGAHIMPDYMIRTTDHLDAGPRRLAARAAHLAAIDAAKQAGLLVYGAAVLNAAGEPVGSLICGHFASRAHVQQWLEQEPYYTEKVWDTIEVNEMRVGPSFAKDMAE